jgi:hypothetical protein
MAHNSEQRKNHSRGVGHREDIREVSSTWTEAKATERKTEQEGQEGQGGRKTSE